MKGQSSVGRTRIMLRTAPDRRCRPPRRRAIACSSCGRARPRATRSVKHRHFAARWQSDLRPSAKLAVRPRRYRNRAHSDPGSTRRAGRRTRPISRLGRIPGLFRDQRLRVACRSIGHRPSGCQVRRHCLARPNRRRASDFSPPSRRLRAAGGGSYGSLGRITPRRAERAPSSVPTAQGARRTRR